MSGFLDPKERVIDMVLTDVGKSLLLKGELQFVYWVPFDDEVDYSPPVVGSGTYSAADLQDRKDTLTESPLVREASMGYRGLSFAAQDTTSVHRPMYSAPAGVGQSFPLPQLVVDPTGTEIDIKQRNVMRYFGSPFQPAAGIRRVGVRRYSPSQTAFYAQYDTGSYPADTQLEGVLITMYQSSTLHTTGAMSGSGSFQEIIHNFDSTGSIVYLNDLLLRNLTPP